MFVSLLDIVEINSLSLRRAGNEAGIAKQKCVRYVGLITLLKNLREISRRFLEEDIKTLLRDEVCKAVKGLDCFKNV